MSRPFHVPLVIAAGIFCAGAAAAQSSYGFGRAGAPDPASADRPLGTEVPGEPMTGRDAPMTGQGMAFGAPPSEQVAGETQRRVDESIREARKAVKEAEADISSPGRRPDTSFETGGRHTRN